MKRILILTAFLAIVFASFGQQSNLGEQFVILPAGSSHTFGKNVNWFNCVSDSSWRLYFDGLKQYGGVSLTTAALALDSVTLYTGYIKPEYKLEQQEQAFTVKAVYGNLYCVYRYNSY